MGPNLYRQKEERPEEDENHPTLNDNKTPEEFGPLVSGDPAAPTHSHCHPPKAVKQLPRQQNEYGSGKQSEPEQAQLLLM